MDALFYYGLLSGVLLSAFGYFLYAQFSGKSLGKPGGTTKPGTTRPK